MHILLAEDDRNFGYVLKNELESRTHKVDHVGDGVEAVLKSMDTRYDFVLLDIRMPKLDGVNALRIIKKVSPDIPAILFTAHGADSEAAAAVAVGAIRCMTKPFNIGELSAEIEKCRGRRTSKGSCN